MAVEPAPSTLAHFVRPIAAKHVSMAVIDVAITALGAKAEQSLAGLDAERKGNLINHFVRNLRNVGVHTASQIERELLEAAGCCPAGRRMVALKDAMSLIAVRNHLHQLATALGLSWRDSMRLQSAVSDVARYVTEHGGGRIELEETTRGLVVRLQSAQDLGPISASCSPAPSWMAGTVNLAKECRCHRADQSSLLEFCFSTAQSMVA